MSNLAGHIQTFHCYFIFITFNIITLRWVQQMQKLMSPLLRVKRYDNFSLISSPNEVRTYIMQVLIWELWQFFLYYKPGWGQNIHYACFDLRAVTVSVLFQAWMRSEHTFCMFWFERFQAWMRSEHTFACFACCQDLCLISAFSVHSTSPLSRSSSNTKWCVWRRVNKTPTGELMTLLGKVQDVVVMSINWDLVLMKLHFGS